MTAPIILRGGTIVDGTGAPPRLADLRIEGAAVTGIGTLPQRPGEVEVDATGRLIMPGFIDAHSHADGQVFAPEVQLALLRQGVTTIVTGQDGVSYGPAHDSAAAWSASYFAGINGRLPQAWSDGVTWAELRRSLTGSVRVNTAHLLPHGTLRYQVAGLSPELDRSQRHGLLELVAQGLADGAVGLSTGLHYVPGLYADVDELSQIGGLLAEAGRPYVTHMRGYEDESVVGLGEVHQIAAASGVAVHVSHLHGPASLLTRLLDDAADDGVDLTFDSYPYLRGFSLLTIPLLPPELLALAPGDLVDALSSPGTAGDVRRHWEASDYAAFDKATIAHAPGFEVAEGLTLRAAAERAGSELDSFAIELLRATGGAVTAVFEQPPTNSEADMRALLRHDGQLGGSDGIFVGGHPHPRARGTFSRFLGHHVRELGDWTWAQAAEHLAARPAERFGLGNRGILREGATADVLLIDPSRVTDRATYAEPTLLSEGIEDVWVGGEQVLHEGNLTATLPGRALTWDY
ncbi:N-acyl-D-amino-acid deacylase family protein [Ruania rhizosphaerae]|uniref:N-acyl-D-amino-acid deacylase family protein n=1 Tax=Ruania rhizosphaerae TaxID=1840413 RepID=UPI00135756A1|nr:amidohydrolase family protein [Ruania rhizosphaerae]